MALRKMRERLIERFTTIDQEGNDVRGIDVLEFIDNYIADENAKYEDNKKNGKLCFGKYKDFTIKEMVSTVKGRDYLSWLLSQSWVTPDKFGWIIDECASYGIKKKIQN